MSIKFSGALTRSNGVFDAIGKEIKSMSLKAVKRMVITFDPFDPNAKPTRDFVNYTSGPRVIDTNPKCILRTNIVCDRSEPTIICDLIQSVQDEHKLKTIKFASKNLTTLEILQLFNKHITAIAPKEEEVKVVATKSQKKRK